MLKRLKSLFIVEVEEQRTKKKVPKPKSEPKSVPNPPSLSESTKGEPGKITNKFLDVLFGVMDKNNLEGFDYLEFKQSLLSLKKMTMDEPTRFKSAYAMAQTMGASVDHLIKTAQHYIEVLAKEEQKFEKALIKQKEHRIGSKEEEINQLNQLIAQKEAQIKKLTKEVNEHKNQVGTLKKHIGDAAKKIETTKNDFIVSYNSLVGQIHEDVENMKKYLK